MSLDIQDVHKIARLARIRLDDAAADRMVGELNAILSFVEQLQELDTDNVTPMTSVEHMSQRLREDVVTDGGKAEAVTANAPESAQNFFVVPKVVE